MSIESTEAENKLWGIKIWDSTGIYYYTEVNISQSIQNNRPTQSQVGLNSKYPFHTHNGIANYFSGSCSGNFSDNKSGECESDYNFDYRIDRNGNYIYNTKYIAGFVKWLHNDRVKQLQLAETLVIPVGILGEVTWSVDKSIEDGETTQVSFNWEQLDDEYSLIGDSSVIKTCPSCGTMIAPTALYCSQCGASIGGALL